jgi:hypothetical protein
MKIHVLLFLIAFLKKKRLRVLQVVEQTIYTPSPSNGICTPDECFSQTNSETECLKADHCYYKAGLNNCVSNCGENYRLDESEKVCNPYECSKLTYGLTTCFLVPICYYEAGSSSCVTSCEEPYEAVNGICTSKTCTSLTYSSSTCFTFDNCFYKEGADKCILDYRSF